MFDEPLAQIASALFFTIAASTGDEGLAHCVSMLRSALDRGLITDPTAREILRDIVEHAKAAERKPRYRAERGNIVRLLPA
jgi:hypothetical protein